MSMSAILQAPPSVYITVDFYRVGEMNLHLPKLVVHCEWCEKTNSDPKHGCMCCLPALRQLVHRRLLEQWECWLKPLAENLDDKDIAADWLEEHDMPHAAHRLRAAKVMRCSTCKGTGRVRDRWKTIWPHTGEPCMTCLRGKRLCLPPLYRQHREPSMTDTQRQEYRDRQDRWLTLPVVQHQTSNYGWDDPITGLRGDPTFRDVQTKLYPDWQNWFQAFFEGGAENTPS